MYQQMLNRVMDIACELLELGFDDNVVVAVFQDRTTDCICSILAIMYTGMIYVPVDADPDSKARSVAIMKDCRPMVLLVDNTTLDSANTLELAEETVIVNVSKADWTSTTACCGTRDGNVSTSSHQTYQLAVGVTLARL